MLRSENVNACPYIYVQPVQPLKEKRIRLDLYKDNIINALSNLSNLSNLFTILAEKKIKRQKKIFLRICSKLVGKVVQVGQSIDTIKLTTLTRLAFRLDNVQEVGQ